jgi:hypothetical protein
MKTIIEIYNMDHYPNWGKALESGGVYSTVIESSDDAIVEAVLKGILVAVNAVDSRAQCDYRIIKIK